MIARPPAAVINAATRPTDPAIIEAIEAELMLSVYNAKRLARLRLMGVEPPPEPNPDALALRRRRDRPVLL